MKTSEELHGEMEQTTLLEGRPPETGAAGEIARLKEEVQYWIEARRAVIDAGNIMYEELKTLKEELKIARDEIERLRAEEWAKAAERERCAKLCEEAVHTLQLPDSPQYDGDVRHVERRVALALAAAIRA